MPGAHRSGRDTQAPDAWVKWFFSDWRADEGLRLCSLGARGLWLELLALMDAATPYGHLIIAGRSPSDADLAKQAACSLAEVRRYKTELREAGVPSLTPEGVWFSRRLVRDRARRERNRMNGAGGGSPLLSGLTTRITDSVNQSVNPDSQSGLTTRITTSVNPSVNPTSSRARDRVPDTRDPEIQKPEARSSRAGARAPAASSGPMTRGERTRAVIDASLNTVLARLQAKQEPPS